jgi:hypothetical protein
LFIRAVAHHNCFRCFIAACINALSSCTKFMHQAHKLIDSIERS